MTLDDLFPRAVIGDEPIEGLFVGSGAAPCWVCGARTRWVSLSFEAPVCSMVCDDLGWGRYWLDGHIGPVLDPFPAEHEK